MLNYTRCFDEVQLYFYPPFLGREPSIPNGYEKINQSVYTKHRITVIQEATCFGCTREPSAGSTRRNIKKGKYVAVAKRRLKSGNACYHSVQNLLSSILLSKNLKIKIYRTIILPVVLYGCETLSLTLREEHRLRVFENRVLRRIFGPKRDRRGNRRVEKIT